MGFVLRLISIFIRLVAMAVALMIAAIVSQGPDAQRSATAIWVCLGIAAVLGLSLLGRRPSRCSMCGNLLKRTFYVWKLEGRKRYLCSHCNQRMERQKSADAFDEYKSRRRG
jgi:hypothetical protein